MACNKLVITVSNTDIAAASDGFVYFEFQNCQGQIVTFAYNEVRTNYATGYNYETAYTPQIYIFAPNKQTATGGSSVTSGVVAGNTSTPYETASLLVPPAYGKKYTLSAIGKSGHTFTAEIWEKAYSGSVYSVGTGPEPFVMNCNASSDDQFEPILSTTFTIQADFTGFTGPLPDFTTTDDRKYHVKFYANGTSYLIWQGFILFDTLSLPFTTGRNFTTINCIDGLAMLKSIPYTPGNYGSVNVLETMQKIINNCLMNIYLPDGYTFNSAVNYYQSVVMSESTSTIRQLYLAPNILLKSQSTYSSCYEVLEKICISLGAQLYQHSGQWWLTSVNEKASDSIRVFTTNWKLVTDTISTKSIKYDIKPYQSDALTPFYFIDNGQVKILQKGFSQIEFTGNIKVPENNITNYNLQQLTNTGEPEGWTRSLGTGGATYDRITVDGYLCQRITAGTSSSTLTAADAGRVQQNEEIDLTIVYGASYTTLNDLLRIFIKIDVGGGNYWTYRKNNDTPYWTYNSATAFYGEPQNSDRINSLNIKTGAAPASGTLTVAFEVTSTGVVGLYLASLTRKGSYPISERVIYNQFAPNPYKKAVDLPIGLPYPYNGINQNQSVYTATNYTALTDVYRYGASSTLYTNLGTLLFNQYFNCISQNQINMQFSQYNIFNTTEFLGLLNTMAITDPSSTLLVNANRYIFGASQFNFISNTIEATALQIRNAVLSYTLVDPADPAASAPTCKRYTNSSGGNWVGGYQQCNGTWVYGVTLTPGQYVCARIFTPFTTSGSPLTAGIDCT